MVQILSHRGNSDGKSAIENTMSAFEMALAEGAEGIETDVRHLRDGSLILYHDRVSPSGVAIDQMDRQELETELGFRLATPAEALSTWSETFWNLEIKSAASVEPLIATIEKIGFPDDRLLLTSFLHDLVAAAGSSSGLAWGVIQVHRPVDPAAWASAWQRHSQVKAMVWDFDFLDSSTVEAAVAAGFDVYSYGMRSLEEHRACENLALTGSITDFLPLALEARKLSQESALIYQ